MLRQQFDRLSTVKQEVMYWLAVNREPMSVAALSEDLVSPIAKRELPAAINSLRRRSLIEKALVEQGDRFSLQPVVMEYVTERLVSQVCEEIDQSDESNLLRTHALMKATAKDFIRESQIRLIVQPIADQLLTEFGNSQNLERQLRARLQQQQQQAPLQPGYTAGNLLNLLLHLKADLQNSDLSELAVWQADLRQVNLAGVNFRNADLSKSVFAEALTGIVSVAFSPDDSPVRSGRRVPECVAGTFRRGAIGEFQPRRANLGERQFQFLSAAVKCPRKPALEHLAGTHQRHLFGQLQSGWANLSERRL